MLFILLIIPLLIINVKSFQQFNNFYFHDSYLILPASLRELAITFDVLRKGFFPFRFMDLLDNPFDYVGKLPAIWFFEDISKEEYKALQLKFKNNNWNLKLELVKYCENDTKTLREIIVAFNTLIYNKFGINIHKFKTAPSLTYYIFLAKFLSKKEGIKIPMITGKLYEFIKQGYKGGHTELYIPEGKNVKQYDVNAMYPNQMAKMPMPVGKVQYFEGNILEFNPDAFGFFLCEIEAPDNLIRPILLTRVKINNKFSTVAPLGKWTDVYFSEEIKNAIKHGYKITVLSGYLFEQAIILDENVFHWNDIKEANVPGTPMYFIAKLMNNSLYGKFGQNPNLSTAKFINEDEMETFLTNPNHEIEDVQEWHIYESNTTKSLIQYRDLTVNLEDKNNNVNVGISAAITAYARIFLSKYLTDPKVKIYYMDTDSLIVDSMPDDSEIGKGLGKWKLEKNIKKYYRIAPKVYGGTYSEPNSNKIKEFVKIKGYVNNNDNINLKNLKTLLKKNKSLELYHNTWWSDLQQGDITIRESLYSLKVTGNKRKLIYKNNKFIGTTPFIINENKDITNLD